MEGTDSCLKEAHKLLKEANDNLKDLNANVYYLHDKMIEANRLLYHIAQGINKKENNWQRLYDVLSSAMQTSNDSKAKTTTVLKLTTRAERTIKPKKCDLL